MATQKGIGVVWGIGTNNVTAGTGVLRPTQQALAKDIEMIEHRDTTGEVVGTTTFNGTRTLELDVYPAGTTLANATDAAINIPAPGSTVALTDTNDTEIGTTWLVTASSKRKTNTDKTVVTLSLKRWDGISTYTTISS
jgi:hypothetical protein